MFITWIIVVSLYWDHLTNFWKFDSW